MERQLHEFPLSCLAAYIGQIVNTPLSRSKPKAIRLSNQTDLARLRRHALGAQGLLQKEPFGRGLSGARKAIEHVGYVQIDTISVVARAHHHVFRARIPNFNPAMTHRLLAERSIFEYWSHAAAFLPMADYRFSLPYKNIMRRGQGHWMRSRDTKLMQEMLNRVSAEGALRSRDVESTSGTSAGWWDWKPAKRALEQLYMEGQLMISDRDGFQKTYDLPERVLPDWVDTSYPSDAELAQHIVDQQLRCHAFASLKGLTYGRRNPELRSAVRRLVTQRLATGELNSIELPGGEQFYCAAGLLDTRPRRAQARMQILSPFDNATIQRERLKSIFDFDYQIECYVPAAKRQYGYFCLPLLYRDRFVGQVDCKAHRRQRQLEVRALHFCSHPYREAELVSAFTEAIRDFAHFQECDTITPTAVTPLTQ